MRHEPLPFPPGPAYGQAPAGGDVVTAKKTGFEHGSDRLNATVANVGRNTSEEHRAAAALVHRRATSREDKQLLTSMLGLAQDEAVAS